MKNYKIDSVLFPTDFSHLNLSALRAAVAICKRQNAKLTLIHVIDEMSLIQSHKSTTSIEEYKIVYIEKCHNDLLLLVKEVLPVHSIEIMTLVEKGNPADVISDVALKFKYNLIVMGTHGNSGFRDNLGSTAFNVVKSAPCPVITIRGDWDKQYFKKILYPIRIEQRVFEKYNYIEPIIEKNNSELIIVGLADKNEPDKIEETKFSIDLLRNMCQEEKIRYSTLIMPTSSFDSAVIDTINKSDADLIVISSHLDYDSKENYLGPFAENIVNKSVCPVLCISPLIHKQN